MPIFGGEIFARSERRDDFAHATEQDGWQCDRISEKIFFKKIYIRVYKTYLKRENRRSLTAHVAIRQDGVASSGRVDDYLRRQVSDDFAELHGCRDDPGGRLEMSRVVDLRVQITVRQRRPSAHRPDADHGHLRTERKGAFGERYCVLKAFKLNGHGQVTCKIIVYRCTLITDQNDHRYRIIIIRHALI